MQPASTAGDCPSPLLHTPGGKVKLKVGQREMVTQRKISNMLMKKKAITKSCVGCVSKRGTTFSWGIDVNLQGEQATTSSTQQTSITTLSTQTHRSCDADQSEKIMQLITEMTACHLLPVCFVEGKGFLSLIHYTEPEYTILSRSSVTSVILIYQPLKCYFIGLCELSHFLHVMCTDRS